MAFIFVFFEEILEANESKMMKRAEQTEGIQSPPVLFKKCAFIQYNTTKN